MYWRDHIKSDKETAGFLIRGLLIFLPVIMLAGFGLYSLRKDRALALNQAEEEAERWINRVVEDKIHTVFPLSSVRFDLSSPIDLPFNEKNISQDPAYLNSSKALLWYLDVQDNLIYPALRHDFPDPASGQQLDLWQKYKAARETLIHANAQKGAGLLAEIMVSEHDGFTPSGHPVVPLAALDWLTLNGAVDLPVQNNRALWVIGSNLIRRPSSYSMRLFEEAEAHIWGAEIHLYGLLKSLADHHEYLRRRYHRIVQANKALSMNMDRFQKGRFQSDLLLVSTYLNDTNEEGFKWLIGWHGSEVTHQLSQVLSKDVPAPYLKMSVGIDGRWFPASPGSETLVSTNLSAFGGRPEMEVQAWLSSPDLLYQRQRQRTQLFGVMIGLASLTVMIGLVTEWKAFLRQKRLNEMKTNFVSSVSHELRTPLASVRLMAEELADMEDVPKDKARTYHDYMAKECVRLSGIIENVLNFSRIEKGTQHYEKEPTEMVSCVRETVGILERYATERKVRLCFQSTYNEIFCLVDARALRQVIVNLIDNAIKHSPEEADVSVEVGFEPMDINVSLDADKQGQRMLDISVTDRGVGIPEADRSRIFDAFFRSGSELRRETQGVGLGLAIVKHIVEAHEGTIQLTNPPEGGCRFVIKLPVLTDEDTDGFQTISPNT